MLNIFKKLLPQSIKAFIKEEIQRIVLNENTINNAEIKEEVHQIILNQNLINKAEIKEEVRQIVLNENTINNAEIKEEVHQIILNQNTINNAEIDKSFLEHQTHYVKGFAKISDQLNILQQEVHLKSLVTPSIGKWYEPIIYESSVNLALRDLSQPGNIIFDVGSNEGGVTLLASRLVGPKGIVCAFEANPQILDLCTHNLVRNGCNNFFVTHACVWKNSHEVLNFYIPPNNSHSASLYLAKGHPQIQVKTLALDDYISSTKLEPDLIKMDIEGAEFEALQGTKKYINEKKPHLILEQFTHDGSCLEFLQNMDYVAIDLNNYKFVKSINDYPNNSQIRNLLFIHKDKIEETPYTVDMKAEEINCFTGDKFTVENQEYVLKDCLNLEKGRYGLKINFIAEREDNLTFLGIYVDNVLRILHIANSSFLRKSYSDCILDIEKPADIKIEIKFLNNTFDTTFSITSLIVYRIINFKGKQTFSLV